MEKMTYLKLIIYFIHDKNCQVSSLVNQTKSCNLKKKEKADKPDKDVLPIARSFDTTIRGGPTTISHLPGIASSSALARVSTTRSRKIGVQQRVWARVPRLATAPIFSNSGAMARVWAISGARVSATLRIDFRHAGFNDFRHDGLGNNHYHEFHHATAGFDNDQQGLPLMGWEFDEPQDVAYRCAAACRGIHQDFDQRRVGWDLGEAYGFDQ
ncbi:integrase-type DNA-binding superfamily protein [Striga asiatica]|uniref:Integrase-type DNA-binding superfamily protein n=1 Tax=Striga asiatica TaxID=4170 RepID=A0A5A7P9Q2_STRAF|nr:integrase-type DNA-binding superfamily protein [Striga asiatica]